jgi:hypothetical protein
VPWHGQPCGPTPSDNVVREKDAITICAALNEGSRLTAKSRRLVTPKDGPSAAAPKAHTPTATTTTEAPRATAATVTMLLCEPVTARGLCAEKEPVGVCVSHLSPIT